MNRSRRVRRVCTICGYNRYAFDAFAPTSISEGDCCDDCGRPFEKRTKYKFWSKIKIGPTGRGYINGIYCKKCALYDFIEIERDINTELKCDGCQSSLLRQGVTIYRFKINEDKLSRPYCRECYMNTPSTSEAYYPCQIYRGVNVKKCISCNKQIK